VPTLTDLIPAELREPRRLFTLDEFAELDRPPCPTCGKPVEYHPARPAGIADTAAAREQRVVAVSCTPCGVHERFPWQPAI
jgi:hypothetical protein